MAIGDVVEHGGHRWCIARMEPGPAGPLARLIRKEGHKYISFLTSPQSVTLIDHPMFAPGSIVRLTDESQGTVLSDDGVGLVQVERPTRTVIPQLRNMPAAVRRRAGYGSGYLVDLAGGVAHVARADLILFNGLI